MGMLKDLGLQGNDYTNAATFTYVAYIAAEVLNSRSARRHMSADLISPSFRNPEDTRSEMARSNCNRLGYRMCSHSRCSQLCDAPDSQNLPRSRRGFRWTWHNRNQQSVVQER